MSRTFLEIFSIILTEWILFEKSERKAGKQRKLRAIGRGRFGKSSEIHFKKTVCGAKRSMVQ
jgi:hypothetical protein